MPSWDEYYQDKQNPGDACWVLTTHQHLLSNTQGLKSLDLACGLGANALLLAKRGFDSHAWDNSAKALDKCRQFARQQSLTLTTLQRDVETHPPEPKSFDLIVVSQFLHRPSCPALIEALRPGGLLFYQTFHQYKLSNTGPSREEFLLKPNELLHIFSTLNILFYREDSQTGNLLAGMRDLSYLVAQKRPIPFGHQTA